MSNVETETPLLIKAEKNTEEDDTLKKYHELFNNSSANEKLKIAEDFKRKTGYEINVYENPKPIVVSIVLFEDYDKNIKILGLTRGNNPHVGEPCLPGGYIDKMENAQMAASRELWEETSLSLHYNNFFVFDTKISKRNTLMIFTSYNKVISYKDIDWNYKNSENLGLLKIENASHLCFETHRQVCGNYLSKIRKK